MPGAAPSRLPALLALPWAALLAAALAWGESPTHLSVRVALLFYAVAVGLLVSLDRAGWRAATTPGRLARAAWALGAAAFLVHVVLAFHHHHGWSHAEAVRHVERASGFGPGVFFSYLFTLLWSADAAWWLLAPRAYAARPAWVGRALHGYLAFIAFNATVVYEAGPVRWAGLSCCTLLAFVALAARRGRGQPSLGELSP